MSVLVGRQAPDFSVTAVRAGETLENFSLSQFRGRKYVVLFFYPLDFTFVCPTELHEFQESLAALQKIDVEVIGASTDSAHSHIAWLNTPRSEGGIKGVSYPILSDFNKTVARDYDVLHDDGMAFRGTFLIDRDGVVQSQMINNLPLGRNIAEVVRLVKAMQFVDKHGEVCPANWQEGSEGMQATREGVTKHFAK